ncbi:iron chaperone [Crossiella sp. CA198]|uniref:iron chaperone n=1 Tax=Crossiella sp. CA198 TaxID=3455607 RepID=UPI003F8D0762
MQSSADTVEEYLAELPADRREIVAAVREVVLANLPEGYAEGMDFGMICWHIPLSRYPKTYNGHPLGYVALASQKQYLSLYLMGIYGAADGAEEFRARFEATGRKLNMGKSCVRFKKLTDLPLDLIGEVVAQVPVERYIEIYENSRGAR